MSKVAIIKIAKAIKKKIKKNNANYISYCRRIERIKTERRICAMTFDDGPTYDSDITKTILDVLDEFGAKGTFDVIGTTESNYPDTEGKLCTPGWSGTRFDHYPKFGEDKNAGAVNCPDLIKRIIDSGHEITNHTYSHVLFGKKNIIYSRRNTLDSYDVVLSDVNKLHSLLLNKYNYQMKFSRPPHYVDKIKGGFTSYDVYSMMGYNYLAASFDGAGWLPCESEQAEIEAMVSPLKNALEKDADALCGQIIFQKDGYNMALRAPVKEGLRRQLMLLRNYGYEVVTVSRLLDESPFSDLGKDDKDFEVFQKLQYEYPIAFSDNTLRPNAIMTKTELAMLIAPRYVTINERLELLKSSKKRAGKIKASLPWSTALNWAISNGYLINASGNITDDDIKRCETFFAYFPKNMTRREIYKAFSDKIQK